MSKFALVVVLECLRGMHQNTMSKLSLPSSTVPNVIKSVQSILRDAIDNSVEV